MLFAIIQHASLTAFQNHTSQKSSSLFHNLLSLKQVTQPRNLSYLPLTLSGVAHCNREMNLCAVKVIYFWAPKDYTSNLQHKKTEIEASLPQCFLAPYPYTRLTASPSTMISGNPKHCHAAKATSLCTCPEPHHSLHMKRGEWVKPLLPLLLDKVIGRLKVLM